jgi:prepilin-type N-terminal cleavage/methylation domain-containing protein
VITLGARGRFLKDERGFTLSEMLVTIMIMSVVLLALSSMFQMSLRVFSYANNKVEAVESARVGLEKMEREIRQAHTVDTATGQIFYTWTPTQIRFGIDLDEDRIIECPNLDTPSLCEKFGYQVYEVEEPPGSGNFIPILGRDNSSTGATNAPGPPNLRPVAENVQSLTFTYYDHTGDQVLPAGDPEGDTEADIDRVLVRLVISVDKGLSNPGTQTLTTVIDLRNR